MYGLHGTKRIDGIIAAEILVRQPCQWFQVDGARAIGEPVQNRTGLCGDFGGKTFLKHIANGRCCAKL